MNPIKVVGVNIHGEVLEIRYIKDDMDPLVDELSVRIAWRKHPKVVKLLSAFNKAVSTYFLTDNKNLDKVPDEEIEKLFDWLKPDQDDSEL